MARGLHVCYFGTALGDLRGAAARDPIVVYDTIMAQGGRFSNFDMTNALAKTVSFLCYHNGYLAAIGPQPYPYSTVSPTEKGRAWREGRLTTCEHCKGEGHTVEMISKRSGLSHPCKPCDSRGYFISHTPTDTRNEP